MSRDDLGQNSVIPEFGGVDAEELNCRKLFISKPIDGESKVVEHTQNSVFHVDYKERNEDFHFFWPWKESVPHLSLPQIEFRDWNLACTLG